MTKKPISLRKAREEEKLEAFIREHEKEGPGDLDKLDATIKIPVQKSSKAPKASSRGESDG